jgi:hypothetical protein
LIASADRPQDPRVEGKVGWVRKDDDEVLRGRPQSEGGAGTNPKTAPART